MVPRAEALFYRVPLAVDLGRGGLRRVSFVPGLDLGFSGFGITVKALRLALVLASRGCGGFVSSYFSFAFAVRSSCGRGGFVFVFSSSSASLF